jgi:hypothetical protein
MNFYDAPGRCHQCGYVVEVATSVGHPHAPRPNDITLCLKCGAIHQFNDDMSLRPSEIPHDADDTTRQLIEKAQRWIRQQKS